MELILKPLQFRAEDIYVTCPNFGSGKKKTPTQQTENTNR